MAAAAASSSPSEPGTLGNVDDLDSKIDRPMLQRFSAAGAADRFAWPDAELNPRLGGQRQRGEAVRERGGWVLHLVGAKRLAKQSVAFSNVAVPAFR